MDYYRISPDEPINTPSPNKRRGLVIIVAGLVIVVIVGILLALVNRQRVVREAVDRSLAVMEAQVAACGEDELCAGIARSDFARMTGRAQGCTDMSEELLDNCVLAAAVASKDMRVCDSAGENGRVYCRDIIQLDRAVERRAIEQCEQIANEGLRGSCKVAISNAHASSGNCPTSLGELREDCEWMRDYLDLINRRAVSECLVKYADNPSTCRDMFAGIDDDGDGLTLLEEYMLGTSDTNPDTDGDGYSDWEEVQTGHNPLGV